MILTVLLLIGLLPGPGVTASKENLALGAKAVQSSTYDFLGDAANAVDGNSNTNYLKKSCSHTHSDNNPWLRVELPDVYNVTSVTIVNRKDCCGDRINGAQIRIGNSLDNKGNDNKLVAVIGPMGSEVIKTYKFKATEGRFVNIFLPGQRKILTLCEVKVYADEIFDPKSFYLHDKEDLDNIALRGTATQSSLHSSEISAGFGLPLNAIDGNRNSDLMKGSCMRTQQETSPWWRLSLPRRYVISSVALTNRGDCCSEHVDGAEIRIGDSLENEGKDNPLCTIVSSIPAGQTEHYNCTDLLEGSYVTVVLPGEERTLSLCEVEVFGLPVARCGFLV
uniref:Fucolectin tachylectin-4 pentraxin-1 domain-containing protein n=1 Tax=Astyanax mexicanus TaxID=7994 RepID=A0A3B1ICN9_ASTMX